MLPPIINEAERMARKIAYLLPGNHPADLRALSFSFLPYQADQPGKVVLRAHFFKPPPEDDLELIGVLETELYAQTWDKFDYAVEAQVTPIGTSMDLLPHIAWIDDAEAYRRR